MDPALAASSPMTSPLVTLGAVSLYALGIFVHFSAECQKHFAMNAEKPTLITDGMYRFTRNPNYLGRLFVYASLSMMCGASRAPWLAIALKWIPIFVPGMIAKDLSLSRYSGFVRYRKKTGILFPNLRFFAFWRWQRPSRSAL